MTILSKAYDKSMKTANVGSLVIYRAHYVIRADLPPPDVS